MGWPSIASIVRATEISRRTVLRLVEVFVSMGLMECRRAEVEDRFGRRTVDAIFLNVALLGQDLTEQFAAEYAKAQGKEAVPSINGRWRLRDAEQLVSETDADVSETRESVSETRQRVSETLPPDPLLGRPRYDPVVDPPPDPVCAGALLPEQQEHIDRLKSEGAGVAGWIAFYADENRRAEEALDGETRKELARMSEYPDLETALVKVCRQCGLGRENGDELDRVMRQVFSDQAEMGKPVWRTAAQMVAMWLLQRRQGSKLRARYGPVNFFRLGYWIDPAGWHWNVRQLEAERASTGSAK